MHSNSPQRIAQHILDVSGSVQDAGTGETFVTNMTCLELTQRQKIVSTDWLFDWHSECCRKDRQVLKLCLHQDPLTIQGLVSITDKSDHIFMYLIENAGWNKGKNKVYCGVAGNLVACACKLSFDFKYDGIVSFVPKTQLVDHYKKTLGAKQFGASRMFIDTREAALLVKQYLKHTIL